MSQSWTPNVYQQATGAHTTMSNVESMFDALKSAFSGASAPSNPVAGQIWFDTAKKLMKHRNNADSAWRGILAGSAALKVWLYLNTAEDGWAIDSSVTDRVLALKGGSRAYNVNGGNLAGNWTISGVSTQNHTLTESEMPAHTHNVPVTQPGVTSGGGPINYPLAGGETDVATESTGGGTGHNHGVSADGVFRPAAAVGTLQYPDV